MFEADDPNWNDSVPDAVPSAQRRTTVTCYSWPGIHPEACMRHHAQQLEPPVEVLFQKGYDGLSGEGGYFERALHRATLRKWMLSGQYAPRPR